MEFNTDLFTCVRTTGSYQTQVQVPASKGMLGHLRNTLRLVTETKEVQFDTAQGDQEDLSGEWEKQYEGTFNVLRFFFYTSRDTVHGHTFPVVYIVFDGLPAESFEARGLTIKLDESLEVPQAKVSFIKRSKKSGYADTFGYEVLLTFRDQAQFNEYVDTLDDEDVVVAKIKTTT